MLVDGGVRTGGGPMRQLGGIGPGSMDRAKWGQNGALLNRYAGAAAIPHTSGLPAGYLHPRSWSMPLKPGGMASRNLIVGEATLVAVGTAGVLIDAALSSAATLTVDGYGAYSTAASITASGSLLVVLSATASVSSDIFSAAALNALLQAAAVAQAVLLADSTLTAIAGLSANIAAPLNATTTLSAEAISGFATQAALSAAGTISGSLVGVFSIDGHLTALGALASTLTSRASAVSALSATSTLNVTTSATSSMVAHITQTAEAINPGTVAQAVWDHITALHLIDTTDETLAEILAGGGSITIGDVQTAMTLQGYTMARGEFLEQLDPERQDGVTQILMQLRAGCIALEQAISQTIPLPYAAYSPRPVVGPPDQQPPVPEPTPPLAVPAVVPVTGLPANYRFMPRQPLNGVRDGANKIFTTVVPFVSSDSVREVVYRSGVRVPVTDYRVNTAERSITFLRAPQPTDTLYLDAYVETAP